MNMFVLPILRKSATEWRPGDGRVFEGKDTWLSELQKSLERVMILKRRARLVWQASEDRHVTNLIRARELRDIGGERVVTLEADMTRGHGACGLSVKSRGVTTPRYKKKKT